MKLPISQKDIRGSFSIWDLIAILLVLAVLGGWFAFAHSGERGRIVRCAANLKELGEVTESYARDHDDGLPIAAIIFGSTNNVTWDMDLYPYLAPGMANVKSAYDRRLLMSACRRFFACPSDPIERSNRRSYAMGGRDMHYGWPPASDDKTGVGVVWDVGDVSILHDEELVKNALRNRDLLPCIKRSVLSDPGDTLLLAEFIDPDNIMGRTTSAVVFTPEEQQRNLAGYDSIFHFKEFNYLMADGHVELLTARQTTGRDGKSHNIWTINAGE